MARIRPLSPVTGATGEANPAWKGGRWVDERGYVWRRVDGRRRREHHIVAERLLGRSLRRGEVVHHVDLSFDNNDPYNLWVFASNADHTHFHHSGEVTGRVFAM
jgi:hypothetical protein